MIRKLLLPATTLLTWHRLPFSTAATLLWEFGGNGLRASKGRKTCQLFRPGGNKPSRKVFC
jgi:hypothetical protein